MFSSKSFIVSHVFEFIFVCGARKYSNFIPLRVPAQFSQHNLLKRSSILHCIFLPLLLQINGFQVYVYFWAVYPVSVICVSVLRPVSQCFDFCSFVVQFEMRVSTTPAPFFFLRVALSVEGLLCQPAHPPALPPAADLPILAGGACPVSL